MKKVFTWRLYIAVVFFAFFFWASLSDKTEIAEADGRETISQDKCNFPLPNPSGMKIQQYRTLLYNFLQGGCYKTWVGDREIRNTGPVLWDGKKLSNYGTHLAVKVYYSPEVWKWMKDKNRQGEIPTGSMIVKEMYNPPATEGSPLTSWTVMVKDKDGSWDGWFWDGFSVGQPPDPTKPVLGIESGFGTYCIRCHSSAAGDSLTFSSIKNVEDDPVIYRVQVPSLMPGERPQAEPGSHERIRALSLKHLSERSVAPASLIPSDIKLPDENYDDVVSAAKGPEQFVTSSQCFGCHSASPSDMLYLFKDTTKKPINLSPYTEWRSSMMGLAGRDPVFHSQVESERALYPDKADFFDNKCFSCHGVMGQRQLEKDRNQTFSHQMIYALPDDEYGKYGSLARDGVSCASCHHIAKDGLGQPSTFTGKFNLDPPNTLNGPFDDVATLPMKNGLGITPQYADQIKSSALCGSCHTVITPTLDKNGKEIGEFYEQTTYLEWLNSDFQNERQPFNQQSVRSCQDCHMPKMYDGRTITSRIANVQDTTYPFSENLAPYKDITIKVRDSYSRHTLVGLNVFVNQMFQQFSSNPVMAGANILGITRTDYMFDSAVEGLVTTENSMIDLARNESAKVEILSARRVGDNFEIQVKVTNLTGHSFPSGVEFRRGFVELLLLDSNNNPVWASGRTNSQGEILDGITDRVLATEYFGNDPNTGKPFQPHYDLKNPISRPNQVQIYEELVEDTDGKITTSFVRLYKHVKDNRLLPRGWRKDGPYAEHTSPFGRAAEDPGYIDPVRKSSSGSNTILYRVPASDLRGAPASVGATLYYQTIPPYYLKDRFSVINRGLPADKTRDSRRLKFLVDNLRVKGTAIENWKLMLVGDKKKIG